MQNKTIIGLGYRAYIKNYQGVGLFIRLIRQMKQTLGLKLIILDSMLNLVQ